MDISYEIIIKYLCDNKEDNTFSNKQNIIQKAEDFTSFKSLFTSLFYRYGIHNYDNENINISFWSALLFCLDKDYLSKDITDIENTINSIKININNKEIINDISNDFFLETVVEYLKINILIFDFKDDNIYSAYYDKDYFNPWRVTVYLARYENFWEPIVSNTQKYFNINKDVDSILSNNILLEEIKYYNENIKMFTINDDIKDILTNEKLYIENTNDDDLDINNNETFISENILLKNLDKNKLQKMKKEDIKNLLNELKINCSIKRPKKQDYIDLISLSLNF